jgi:hypothetical protein
MVSVTTRPRFTPGERTPGTHWTGGWVGPRAGLDTEARGKILCLCRGSNPGRPARSQDTILTELPRLHFALVEGLKYDEENKWEKDKEKNESVVLRKEKCVLRRSNQYRPLKND